MSTEMDVFLSCAVPSASMPIALASVVALASLLALLLSFFSVGGSSVLSLAASATVSESPSAPASAETIVDSAPLFVMVSLPAPVLMAMPSAFAVALESDSTEPEAWIVTLASVESAVAPVRTVMGPALSTMSSPAAPSSPHWMFVDRPVRPIDTLPLCVFWLAPPSASMPTARAVASALVSLLVVSLVSFFVSVDCPADRPRATALAAAPDVELIDEVFVISSLPPPVAMPVLVALEVEFDLDSAEPALPTVIAAPSVRLAEIALVIMAPRLSTMSSPPVETSLLCQLTTIALSVRSTSKSVSLVSSEPSVAIPVDVASAVTLVSDADLSSLSFFFSPPGSLAGAGLAISMSSETAPASAVVVVISIAVLVTVSLSAPVETAVLVAFASDLTVVDADPLTWAAIEAAMLPLVAAAVVVRSSVIVMVSTPPSPSMPVASASALAVASILLFTLRVVSVESPTTTPTVRAPLVAMAVVVMELSAAIASSPSPALMPKAVDLAVASDLIVASSVSETSS